MTSDLESEASNGDGPRPKGQAAADLRENGWLKVGIIAAASALAGGLAAAWVYRKTLIQLHEAENHILEAEVSSSEDDSA